MKRFHVHVSVPELKTGISFYNKMFGAEPTVIKHDYAKWMLDDPRVNFAISSRGARSGVNHLGFQVESDTELTALRQQAEQADLGAVEEADAACCYAHSNKHWITDPAGVAWENFHTLGEIPVFGTAEQNESETPGTSVCCPRPAVEARETAACCS